MTVNTSSHPPEQQPYQGQNTADERIEFGKKEERTEGEKTFATYNVKIGGVPYKVTVIYSKEALKQKYGLGSDQEVFNTIDKIVRCMEAKELKALAGAVVTTSATAEETQAPPPSVKFSAVPNKSYTLNQLLGREAVPEGEDTQKLAQLGHAVEKVANIFSKTFVTTQLRTILPKPPSHRPPPLDTTLPQEMPKQEIPPPPLDAPPQLQPPPKETDVPPPLDTPLPPPEVPAKHDIPPPPQDTPPPPEVPAKHDIPPPLDIPPPPSPTPTKPQSTLNVHFEEVPSPPILPQNAQVHRVNREPKESVPHDIRPQTPSLNLPGKQENKEVQMTRTALIENYKKIQSPNFAKTQPKEKASLTEEVLRQCSTLTDAGITHISFEGKSISILQVLYPLLNSKASAERTRRWSGQIDFQKEAKIASAFIEQIKEHSPDNAEFLTKQLEIVKNDGFKLFRFMGDLDQIHKGTVQESSKKFAYAIDSTVKNNPLSWGTSWANKLETAIDKIKKGQGGYREAFYQLENLRALKEFSPNKEEFEKNVHLQELEKQLKEVIGQSTKLTAEEEKRKTAILERKLDTTKTLAERTLTTKKTSTEDTIASLILKEAVKWINDPFSPSSLDRILTNLKATHPEIYTDVIKKHPEVNGILQLKEELGNIQYVTERSMGALIDYRKKLDTHLEFESNVVGGKVRVNRTQTKKKADGTIDQNDQKMVDMQAKTRETYKMQVQDQQEEIGTLFEELDKLKYSRVGSRQNQQLMDFMPTMKKFTEAKTNAERRELAWEIEMQQKTPEAMQQNIHSNYTTAFGKGEKNFPLFTRPVFDETGQLERTHRLLKVRDPEHEVQYTQLENALTQMTGLLSEHASLFKPCYNKESGELSTVVPHNKEELLKKASALKTDIQKLQQETNRINFNLPDTNEVTFAHLGHESAENLIDTCNGALKDLARLQAWLGQPAKKL